MQFSIPAVVLFAVAAATAAIAGPVSDFETAFRQMYGDYRAALFLTNTGQQAESAGAMASLDTKFADLRARYGSTPPPQYADDAQWDATLSEVQAIVAKATEEVDAGALPEAHETLEEVRGLFGALHQRNGVQTFSDRMNAYHAQMEKVLGTDMATTDIGQLREEAAVLDYLAREIIANPPSDATGNAAFAALSADLEASVAAFLTATRSGDMAEVRAAAATLKKPYSKLFLKFG
ncbi:hypothetical protein [Tropicimonas sp. IMCC34043]|uniref:hypothetical protein n=1 Tax=Tropicimonas sp. IMCC34043 TaxID=2248760 RepID=UPI000E26BA5E|nr:hypothetical protein [Tropicimonas sp. IMCC34043]